MAESTVVAGDFEGGLQAEVRTLPVAGHAPPLSHLAAFARGVMDAAQG